MGITNAPIPITSMAHSALTGVTSAQHHAAVTTLAHSALSGVATGDHHAQAHTAASHSDQSATGAELNELTDASVTTLHSHAPTVALALQGVATTEVTTTSTSPVDLITVSGVSIGINDYTVVHYCAYKSDAAYDAYCGLKLNGVVIQESDSTDYGLHFDAASAVQQGMGEFRCAPRSNGVANANVAGAVMALYKTFTTATGAHVSGGIASTTMTGLPPALQATITSVILRGAVVNAAVTLRCGRMIVQSMGVS